MNYPATTKETTVTATHNPTNAQLTAYKERVSEILNAGGFATHAWALFPRWRTNEPTLFLEASSGSRIATCNTDTGEIRITTAGRLAERCGEHHQL